MVLASGSPRRKEFLGHLKIPYKIITADTDELSDTKDPREFCREIALEKGTVVLKKCIEEKLHDKMIVISADTIVYLNGKIFGKPKTRDEARAYLLELSGKTHSVMTGVVIQTYQNGETTSHSFVEESEVTFNPISDVLMEKYLDTGDSMDKAGAYGIQGAALTFISKINGDFANVAGFPLSRFVIEFNKILKQISPAEDSWEKLF